MIFDPQSQNFTNSLPLPTPNSNPLGIAIDSSTGQIWIAEGIGKIANIDPATNFTINEYPAKGTGGQENGILISPTSLLIDPSTGVIYISKHDGHVVSVFNPIFKTFSDFPPIAEDALPFGTTLDKDRNLWVAEHVTNRLAVIDPSSSKNKEVTLPSSSPFVQYLTTDNEGKVWFAAQRGNAIGYITSSVLQNLSSSSSSVDGRDRGQMQGEAENEASSLGYPILALFVPLFSIGYEYLLGPIIAIGVIISAVFYVNSVVSLKTTIRKVSGLFINIDITG
ncbi:MAG: hypothetical protein ACRDMA_09830 [Solirubrobacterales bacterium]